MLQGGWLPNADDTIVYAIAYTSDQVQEQTRQLASVSQWLQDNWLTQNYTKTVSMCFSLKNKGQNSLKVSTKQMAETSTAR